MSKPVRLDDEADEELSAAVSWYEKRLPGLGLDLLNEANEAKRRLAERPSTCARLDGVPVTLGVRRRQVHGFP